MIFWWGQRRWWGQSTDLCLDRGTYVESKYIYDICLILNANDISSDLHQNNETEQQEVYKFHKKLEFRGQSVV